MGRKTNSHEYCIYVHVFPNGKKYVGQTCVEPEIRWRQGKRYSGLMKRAIDKYGWENIHHIILATNLDYDTANKAEKYYIGLFSSNNPQFGYNITSGGDGYRGTTHKNSTKEVLRQRAIEQWARQKAEGYTPPPITEEHRKHLSEAHMGQPAWNKGKHTMTEETKERLREARKRFWEEVRNGVRENPNRREKYEGRS